MIHQLTPEVWFGDKNSVEESLGQVKSILNVAHRIRKPYWQNLKNLDWDVWYFRLAKPDGVGADEDYLEMLDAIADAVRFTNRLPLLCHCQMGVHRGPTSAMFMAWCLGGRKDIELYYEKALKLAPGLERMHRRKRAYHWSIYQYCLAVEKGG